MILVVGGCDVGLETTTLRVEPEVLDLTVELGKTHPVAITVLADGLDVTAHATFVLDGAPLGELDERGFTSDGRTGGRATVTVHHDGLTTSLPLRVVLHSARGDAPPQAVGWFGEATPLPMDALLEPGDGAVLPRNLANLDVHFAVPATDDLHEIAILAPELDFHIYGRGAAGARTAALTPAEWDAITRTSRGGYVDIIARTLSSAAPTEMHVASAHVVIADHELAAEVLFTGRRPTDPVSQVWSYALARGTTEPWANGANGDCIGCHLAISRDGKRIAAASTYTTPTGTTFGGGMMDAKTRYFMAPPSASIGMWQSAAFGPDDVLVSAAGGVLTLRDGFTALPLRNLPTEQPAAQPAVASNRIAFAAGPIDPVATIPIQEELRVAAWDPKTFALGASRVLAPKIDGTVVKLPDFSPDERWVTYTRATEQFKVPGDIMITLADGTIPSLTLARGFDMARFASSLEAARAGGTDTEPMVWIVMRSNRPVGARSQEHVPQLWAMAFYPEKGIASRPFYLPGQDPQIGVLHAPTVLAAR